MDDRQVLQTRIKALRESLTRAQASVAAMEQYEPNLTRLVESRFRQLINDEKSRLESLGRSVRYDQSLAEKWQRYLAIQRRCDEIFPECLAFVEGVLVRHEGIDQGICAAADALLAALGKELSQTDWPRFTLLGSHDYYPPMTDVIRLRFPEFSVWSLPIAVHEFAHYVEAQTEAKHFAGQFQRVIEREINSGLARLTDDPWAEDIENQTRIMQELFADLFAVYAMGPAYAGACIMLLFDPAEADHKNSWQRQHPSDCERTYFLFEALHRIQEECGDRRYDQIVSALSGIWAGCRRAAGEPTSLEGIYLRERLDWRLDSLYEVVSGFSNVRYDNWKRAGDLANHQVLEPSTLLNTEDIAAGLSEVNRTSQPISLIDVLNAGWRRRIYAQSGNTGALDRKVGELFRLVAEATQPIEGHVNHD